MCGVLVGLYLLYRSEVDIIFLLLVSRSRSKTNASNATHASKPYRTRVSRVAFCLPKRHTCHPNATQAPHACRTNRQSRLIHRAGSSLPVFTAVSGYSPSLLDL